MFLTQSRIIAVNDAASIGFGCRRCSHVTMPWNGRALPPQQLGAGAIESARPAPATTSGIRSSFQENWLSKMNNVWTTFRSNEYEIPGH
jgi:hypothetical protein